MADDERSARALGLHLGGASYGQIASALNISKSTAHKLVQDALAAGGFPTSGPSADDITTELARLDALLTAVWPKAHRGDLQAVDRVLKIEERRQAVKMRAAAAPPAASPAATEGEVLDVDQLASRRAERAAAAKHRAPTAE